MRVNRSGAYTAAGQQDAGRLIWHNVTLMSCLQYAYSVLGYQVSGPGWLDSERYDIDAIKPSAATDAQVRVMVQNLLAERFRLSLHREERETSVYALHVSRNGLRFKAASPGTPSRIRSPRFGIEGTASSMASLAYLLMRWTDRIVLDETGLKGLYDFKLTLKPEGPSQDATSLMSELFSALDQQLGLPLESEKALIGFLVVDHAQRTPADN